MFSFILLHESNEDDKQPVPVYVRWSNLTHAAIFKFFFNKYLKNIFVWS